jgi:hypothetical protein
VSKRTVRGVWRCWAIEGVGTRKETLHFQRENKFPSESQRPASRGSHSRCRYAPPPTPQIGQALQFKRPCKFLAAAVSHDRSPPPRGPGINRLLLLLAFDELSDDECQSAEATRRSSSWLTNENIRDTF